MGKGKIAVQCAHAAVSAAEIARKRYPEWWKPWMSEGQKKIAVKVPDEDTLQVLLESAEKHRLPVYLVRDKGLTQIPADTITCLGIGPAPTDLVDRLTGDLPLL
jgi:PTH2 family peptidyl-tRNA hydrolase